MFTLSAIVSIKLCSSPKLPSSLNINQGIKAKISMRPSNKHCYNLKMQTNFSASPCFSVQEKLLKISNDSLKSPSITEPDLSQLDSCNSSSYQTAGKLGKSKKQNKNEANASRTARIVLYSLIEDEFGRKDVSIALGEIGFKIDGMKEKVREMGEKEFIKLFFSSQKFSDYLKDAFEMADDKTVRKVLRVNRNSKLSYEQRISYVLKNISRLRQLFQSKMNSASKPWYGHEHMKQQEQGQLLIILQPVPLYPMDYEKYMTTKQETFPNI